MKKLLYCIGIILDGASEEVAARARALLFECSNPSRSSQGTIVAGFINLVCAYIEEKDPGAEYDPLEFVADLVEDWIKFDPEKVAKPRPRLKRGPEYRNPDFFPLLAEASLDDGFEDDWDEDFGGGYGGDE